MEADQLEKLETDIGALSDLDGVVGVTLALLVRVNVTFTSREIEALDRFNSAVAKLRQDNPGFEVSVNTIIV